MGLLFTWFFFLIMVLWLLKPVRQASLLTNLGSEELPWVRLGSVVAVALVVMVYSRVVDRLSRVDVARGASFLFAGLLALFWVALTIGVEALGAQRWFVWSVFILVDVYSTVMVGIFWTYTNDVVSRSEADKLYGPIGLGGILGGIAGGVVVDALVGWMGNVNVLLVCCVIGAGCGVLAWIAESVLRPPPRAVKREEKPGALAAFEGMRQVVKSRYLLLIVGIVVGYEFAAATADFVVSVVFEENFQSEAELAAMFGRVGWIVSVTALVSQFLVVPMLLPMKRIALLVPPIAMIVATFGLIALPVVWMAIVLSAADRGLNYSIQQVTKETLYVPLSDVEKYKAKAFIDMIVDRAAKAFSAIALVAIIAFEGVSVPISLGVTLVALVVWAICAALLGRAYKRRLAKDEKRRSEHDEQERARERPMGHPRPRYGTQ